MNKPHILFSGDLEDENLIVKSPAKQIMWKLQ